MELLFQIKLSPLLLAALFPIGAIAVRLAWKAKRDKRLLPPPSTVSDDMPRLPTIDVSRSNKSVKTEV